MPLLYDAPPQSIALVDIRLRSAAWIDRQVAGAARIARDAVVAGVHEADELGGFAIEQRVAVRRIGARRILPRQRITRQHVRVRQCRLIRGVLRFSTGGLGDRRIAAVAIGAAQHHGRIDVHRRVVGGRVAVDAATRLGQRSVGRLLLGRGRLPRRTCAGTGFSPSFAIAVAVTAPQPIATSVQAIAGSVASLVTRPRSVVVATVSTSRATLKRIEYCVLSPSNA